MLVVKSRPRKYARFNLYQSVPIGDSQIHFSDDVSSSCRLSLSRGSGNVASVFGNLAEQTTSIAIKSRGE